MDGSVKRIGTLAAALHAGITVEEMMYPDLGYTPPFSPVWNPVATAAREVARKLQQEAGLFQIMPYCF
jgi:hypothetical protein